MMTTTADQRLDAMRARVAAEQELREREQQVREREQELSERENNPADTHEEPQPLTRADLKGLAPAEINKLHQEGKLDHLLGRTPRPAHEGPLTRADLNHLTPADLIARYNAGDLNHLI